MLGKERGTEIFRMSVNVRAIQYDMHNLINYSMYTVWFLTGLL